MRRKYFGWAIAAIATLGPMQAWGGDREIAEQIISKLKSNRDSGALKDFTLDMKVDDGVVMFKGNVSKSAQKKLVLKSAEGIEGITKVVDQVSVSAAVAQAETPATDDSGFSFSKALASEGVATQGVVPGIVLPTAAVEPILESPVLTPVTSDQQITDSVVSALGAAQQNGQLKGFGVDVQTRNGTVEIVGQASTAAQRDLIVQIAENTPGIAGLRENISTPGATAQVRATPASHVAHAGQQAMTAPYQMNQAPQNFQPAGMQVQGAPTMGQPVPMGPYQGGGAPRYDTPNLPNYAWPGYAAYPNYAAVTYPQQYSPSAFPYIGPFYPYPQVPLGWRKVSLEWEDGWWQLDFTDR